MKRISLSLAALVAALFVLPVQAQTITNTSPASDITSNLLGGFINNAAIDVYGVYAPKAPHKWGGGLDVCYNIVQDTNTGISMGPAAGVEYLGQWWAFSGTLQFKVSTHPLKFLGGFATNIVFTPIITGGITTSTGGVDGSNSGAVGAVVGAGGMISLFTVSGFQVSGGYVLDHWTGTGPYDGVHHLAGFQVGKAF